MSPTAARSLEPNDPPLTGDGTKDDGTKDGVTVTSLSFEAGVQRESPTYFQRGRGDCIEASMHICRCNKNLFIFRVFKWHLLVRNMLVKVQAPIQHLFGPDIFGHSWTAFQTKLAALGNE